MHSSVLQSKKYIEFAEDNTVEVMALGRLDEGIQKGDPKAATYKTKDENGNEVEYLVSWPNLTVDDIQSMRGSPAGQFNQTGKIPYPAIVDPHTGKQMKGLPGGQSAKGMMEKIAEYKEELEEKYGPSLKRSDLRKFQEGSDKVAAVLKDKGVAKAFVEYRKLEKTAAKMGERVLKKAEVVQKTLLDAAESELEKIADLLDSGDVGAAKKALNPLKRVLKKTPLQETVDDLYAKLKAAAEK